MKKKIAIYGAGNYGRTVVNILKKTKHIFVVLICDSDKSLWGEKFEDYIIVSPDRIIEEDLDGVFIAILSDNNVDKEILRKKNIKIYKKIHELVAEFIYWDISNKCNAKCKYCVTGYNNRKHNFKCIENSYMSLEMFKKNYRHLYEKGIISKESHLGLYNWKESFINPHIMDILNYCSQEDQKYSLSTNGSIVRYAKDKNTYLKCEQIVFSMPGFSQKSYDRIHGFSFAAIKKNIIELKEDMIAHGFSGKIMISAHVYKFSEMELEDLIKWAKKEGITVNAYHPYLAGNSLAFDYFEDKLEKKFKEDIRKDLFVEWNKKINLKNVCDFDNPLCHQLTIDEEGNITLCCVADEFCNQFDVWGKIEDLKSYEDYIELKKRMLESKTCEQCKKYAIAYRICNNN